MKKVLFIDRDGTLIQEPPITFQVDTLEQLSFLPGVIRNLQRIVSSTDYELVMVTNQDGLGTDAYPEERFNIVQEKMLELLGNEGIRFAEILVDRSFPSEGKDTRKPGIGLLRSYFGGSYDLDRSYVIGDRVTDVQLAINMGTKAIFIRNNESPEGFETNMAFRAESWDEIGAYLCSSHRKVQYCRKTAETDIHIAFNPDGRGSYRIDTGLGFFNHMLEQLARHGGLDLDITAKGDLHVDEHHTVEDVGIALGAAFARSLGSRKNMERYGYCLPMDDCRAQVFLDFGGRSWLVWEANFRREKIGDVPAELFSHFFKSFCDGARCNLHIIADGENEHHKIESIFKAVARSIRMAVRTDTGYNGIPTTKGFL